LGQVSLLEIEACANQSVVGVIGSKQLPNEFVYFWVKENIDILISWQTGGAQQHINKNNVNALGILCPSKDVIRAYTAAVRPMFDVIRNNCFESRTLAELRDALLPKLLSGELRVKQTLHSLDLLWQHTLQNHCST
jgi:type I restriction enzyme S subunit